ncbi:hybrid-cluster NAD(P)-dependent oxidoreductase [Vibrio hannami]|uniref:hybrid-cluster NAD(P)-dependent oxidoreductase n=1 Tax=Vibrio hannami TaxID=2717094 RepID=UPI00240EC8B2|nr:hybrid-cluster NAD(P)-dependent oxidoreductase [Vibrio hannami]MDG3085094.1 hybrid-cluster NAD(P)-dependent oxidoreductase [Vibrio hannami]
MFEWTHSDSVQLICRKKWFETPDSVSFELEAEQEDLQFNFKPGQFASLGFEIDGKTEYRAYSINSLPGDSTLKFTVKKVENGLVSNFILDELNVDQSVMLLKPTGAFNNIDCAHNGKVTMVSAGCGITPVMSMVKYWLEHNSEVDIDFIHMARNKENTIYFDELELLATQHDNFNLRLLLKDSSGTEHPQGRLDKEWLYKLSPDLSERTVYLCGPVGFMEDIKQYLTEENFDLGRFYQESYTPKASVEVEEEGKSSANVGISVPSFGTSVEAEHGSVLVDSLESAGLPIIAACRSGICGSCKCKVEKGEVESTSKETLTEQEIEDGYVLACSTVVKSDVEVSLN